MLKKVALIALLLIVPAIANAQNRSRFVFDNFETATGVQIQTPTVTVVTNAKPKLTNSKIKKSVKSFGESQVIVVGKPKKQPLTQAGFVKQTIYTQAGYVPNGKSLGSFTTGNSEVDGYIQTSCARYNIDPYLIYAQMSKESAFKQRAISNKGARGLMQLMPATAVRFGVTNIFDPKQNIDAGVKYMRWLLDTFKGDVRLALAGYNAGEGAVMKYGYAIPPYAETQDYVKRITERYSMIRNPNFVKQANLSDLNNSMAQNNRKPAQQVAKNNETVTLQADLYEPNLSAIRLANGKIQLITQ
ncbi:MAG: lytic transglycosylase domain-containing protein [Pyrinomonadaceae bacterium]|nr:lytic transglycosylase domain-containing protein [Pyrinomonadaceae bacterium]